MEDEIVIDATPNTTITVAPPVTHEEVIETDVVLPVEEITYKTTLRHFTLEETKLFPPKTVINFSGINFEIAECSDSRMILKPIGTRERVTKKTAGV